MSDRVEVSIGVTRNLGDFNSLRLDTRYTTDVRSDESPENAFDRAWTEAEAQLEAKAAEYQAD